MFDRILKTMRDKVRTREYVMTLHAEEEMDADGLSIYDVENALLTGKIMGRQAGRTRASRSTWSAVARWRVMTRSWSSANWAPLDSS